MAAASNDTQSSLSPLPRKLLIVLTGPSGVGKDAVLDSMKKAGSPFCFITTMTTRTPRTDERDGIEYHFISTDRFQHMIDSNELLEWARVYDNWYGVPKKAVKTALDKGEDVMVKVDVQGASAIKRLLPQAVVIFLMPPTMEELQIRLKGRNTEQNSEMALRLDKAEREMKLLPLFDYVVVNNCDEIDRTVAAINTIITAEKFRVVPREINL
ncbi:MAG: guanylate kinase [Dehalococcoidales bacterium]|nr:MAG: guanylate kinase [Dehalococcoidales bacterium]